jgi:hypothetical protein
MNCSSSRLKGEWTISRARAPGAYETAVNVAVNGGGDHLPAGAAAPAETTVAATAAQPAAATQRRG